MKIPYSHLEKGSLLIASPEMTSTLYARSVILLCEHAASGSFGLIINKPLDVELPEDILNVKHRENPRVEIRAGGPTSPNQLLLLHTSNRIPDQTLCISEGVFLGGDLQFLQEVLADPNGCEMRICFGYSAWGSGQLEREFMSGSWILYPASAHYIFHCPPEMLWKTLLHDMGGKWATLSTIPEDLSLN